MDDYELEFKKIFVANYLATWYAQSYMKMGVMFTNDKHNLRPPVEDAMCFSCDAFDKVKEKLYEVRKIRKG